MRVDTRYCSFLRFIVDTILAAASRVLLDRRALGDIRLELDERDRLYRALFEHSDDGALICSPGGRILAANPAACRTLGYREDEIQALGRGGFVLDTDGTLSHALASRDRERKFAGTLTFRRKDGTPMKVDVSSTLFEDEATGQRRAVVFFRDAAPRLAAQQRIAATARLNAVGELQEAELVLEASLRAAGVTRQRLAFSRQQPMKPSGASSGA